MMFYNATMIAILKNLDALNKIKNNIPTSGYLWSMFLETLCENIDNVSLKQLCAHK